MFVLCFHWSTAFWDQRKAFRSCFNGIVYICRIHSEERKTRIWSRKASWHVGETPTCSDEEQTASADRCSLHSYGLSPLSALLARLCRVAHEAFSSCEQSCPLCPIRKDIVERCCIISVHVGCGLRNVACSKARDFPY